jgi:hypothetical protein
MGVLWWIVAGGLCEQLLWRGAQVDCPNACGALGPGAPQLGTGIWRAEFAP